MLEKFEISYRDWQSTRPMYAANNGMTSHRSFNNPKIASKVSWGIYMQKPNYPEEKALSFWGRLKESLAHINPRKQNKDYLILDTSCLKNHFCTQTSIKR